MTLLLVTALWLTIAVCFCLVSRREPQGRRPRMCLGDRTGTRTIVPTPAPQPDRVPKEFSSTCGRRFTSLEVRDWACFAELRAREALRSAPSVVTANHS